MSNISKLIGGIVGGVLGLLAAFIYNQFGLDLGSVVDTAVNTLTPLIVGWIGIYFAPANKPSA